jgi:hypothetical protein
MKRGNFDDRIAKCLDQLREVETRARDRRHRLGLGSRVARNVEPDAPPRKG